MSNSKIVEKTLINEINGSKKIELNEDLEELKTNSLNESIDAIKEYVSNANLDTYSKMTTKVNLLSLVMLIEKADISSLAAVELSKQYPIHVPLPMATDYKTLTTKLSKTPLSNEQLENVKRRLDLMPLYQRDLTVEEIKIALKSGELTIENAGKLMRTISLEKISDVTEAANIFLEKETETLTDAI